MNHPSAKPEMGQRTLMPALALLTLFIPQACSQNFAPGPSSSQPSPSREVPAAPLTAAPSTPGSESGRVHFEPPAEWIQETPGSRMRRAQYRLSRAQGDSEDAQVLVFHFPGQGGGLEDNARRWIGQMRHPDGSPATDSVRRSEKMVHGQPVVLLDVSGTYQGSMGVSQGSAKPNYRLLGAMLETPNGPWFFKLTGPQKTVEKWLGSWETFTDSIRVQ